MVQSQMVQSQGVRSAPEAIAGQARNDIPETGFPYTSLRTMSDTPDLRETVLLLISGETGYILVVEREEFHASC